MCMGSARAWFATLYTHTDCRIAWVLAQALGREQHRGLGWGRQSLQGWGGGVVRGAAVRPGTLRSRAIARRSARCVRVRAEAAGTTGLVDGHGTEQLRLMMGDSEVRTTTPTLPPRNLHAYTRRAPDVECRGKGMPQPGCSRAQGCTTRIHGSICALSPLQSSA
jgi:hypothetical protein